MQQHIQKWKTFCVGIKTAFKYLSKRSSEHYRKESKQPIFLGSIDIDVFQGNLSIDDIEYLVWISAHPKRNSHPILPRRDALYSSKVILPWFGISIVNVVDNLSQKHCK